MIRLAEPLRRSLRTACALLIAAGAARAQGPDGPGPGAPSASSTTTAEGYDEGFFLRSADGSAELRLEGLLRAEGIWNGAQRRPQSEYELEKLRLDFSGRFEDAFRFRLQPDFADESVELEEAWVGADLFGGDARFMAGQMRVPFGLEEMRSQSFIDFPRFSILHQLTPAEDIGLFLFGHTPRGRWEWNVSVSNGTGGADTNGQKDFSGRLMIHPFRDDRRAAPPVGWRRALEHLQLGVAFTGGKQEEEIGGETIDNAVGLPLMFYASGARLDGLRTRLGLEGAWYQGPWFAQGELMKVDQEMSIDGDEQDIEFEGGYLDLSYVLTGESKSFDGVVPERSFDPRTGRGTGAWIVALRYSELHTEGELAASGLLVPETWVGRVRSVELGLDWVLSRHAMLRAAYIRSFYSNEVLVGDELVDGEDAVILQFQASF